MLKKNIEAAVNYIQAAVPWTPDWVIGVATIVFAIFVALIVHRIMLVALRRTFSSRENPIIRHLTADTRGPSCLALVILAVNIVLPAVSLKAPVETAISKALLLGFIILVGWIAHVAVKVTAQYYLGRFDLNAPDNMLARKYVTQMRLLKRSLDILILFMTLGAALMSFETARQFGVSLFASAGVAGLVVGFAARPVLSNVIAGIQIAITTPIRIEDVVIVEGEWGRIEEITATYVVVRIWDLRRLVVPLTYFIEQPFQNWTRMSSDLLGTVFIYTDYTVPVERIRAKAEELAKESPLWNGKFIGLQVTDVRNETLELRVLASAANSGDLWHLRCELREKLITFLQTEFPHALPRRRQEVTAAPAMDSAELDRIMPQMSASRPTKPA